MLSGDITVSTDSGEVKRLTGLNILEGKAGKKRAGYAHEDTHWITFHVAEERDPEEMYEFLTCGSFEEFEEFNILVSRADYKNMVQSLGMTEEEVSAQVKNEKDMIPMPKGYEFLDVKESRIHGVGLFSDVDHNKGAIICPARVGPNRTIAGRYTNHAFEPNAAMVVTSDGVDLVAIKDIEPGHEITVNYRDVIEHRNAEGDLCQG
jgi:transposase